MGEALGKEDQLTPRQKQICDRIMQGKTDKQIARELQIAPRTVEDHKSRIYAVMGVHNAVSLVIKLMGADREVAN